MTRRHRQKVYNGKQKTKNSSDSRYDPYGVKYIVQEDRAAAVCKLSVTKRKKDYDGSVEIELDIPIIALWRDPRRNVACKCHLMADLNMPEQRMFVAGIIAHAGTTIDSLEFTAESSGIIRVGARAGQNYSCYDRDSYNNYTIYDCKANALSELLSQISGHTQVAGMNLINLACVPDEALLEVGYERVPDLMGKSSSMWIGDPRQLLRSARSESGSWEVVEQNCKSFLKIIEQYL